MVLCEVLAPYTMRRTDGSIASAGDRVVLGDARAQRLAGQGVVAIVEPVG